MWPTCTSLIKPRFCSVLHVQESVSSAWSCVQARYVVACVLGSVGLAAPILQNFLRPASVAHAMRPASLLRGRLAVL
jgi:hypothetical protein